MCNRILEFIVMVGGILGMICWLYWVWSIVNG